MYVHVMLYTVWNIFKYTHIVFINLGRPYDFGSSGPFAYNVLSTPNMVFINKIFPHIYARIVLRDINFYLLV